MNPTQETTPDDAVVVLISNEGQEFRIPYKAIRNSLTVRSFIEDSGTDDPIPLPNVSGPVLARVVEYLNFHVRVEPEDFAKKNSGVVNKEYEKMTGVAVYEAEAKATPPNQERDDFDAEYVKVDKSVIFDLVLAANYLNIKTLLDMMCKSIADMIKGKTTEEIRKTFNIKNDFTPEEEEEVRKENQWAFE
jgi:S-phase kinase-associated protein 1